MLQGSLEVYFACTVLLSSLLVVRSATTVHLQSALRIGRPPCLLLSPSHRQQNTRPHHAVPAASTLAPRNAILSSLDHDTREQLARLSLVDPLPPPVPGVDHPLLVSCLHSSKAG